MSSQGSSTSSRSSSYTASFRNGIINGGRGGGRAGRGGGGGQGSGSSTTTFSTQRPRSVAAAATASSRIQAGYASYVVPKAKNPNNQHLLDSLALSRSKIDPTKNKFAHTLKTAMDNLSKHTEAVTTYKEACQVRGIGQKIAHMLFPHDMLLNSSSSRRDSNEENSEGGGSGARRRRYAAELANDDDDGDANDVRTTIDGGEQGWGRPKKKMRQTTLADAGLSLAAAAASTAAPMSQPSPSGSVASHASAASSTASNPTTRRQLRYHKEKSASDHQLWKNQNLVWNVLFLLDNREKKDGRDRLSDKFSSANIPFEVRALPIGDMTWIAQGRKRTGNNSSPSKGPVVVELLLGTIIERKTLEDLKASIYGTRYAEQRMRMSESGVSQCMLLVEGNVHREAHPSENTFLETIHTAMWETSLYMNFQIIRTADLGETIATLKLLHRRILQRSFPHAFASEVLPNFDGGPYRDYDDTVGNVHDQQRHALAEGQRRRRRYQSLHKLVFDTPPVMPPEMHDRYVTYDELKGAKIGRDREAGLKTVRMVHGAMVKQVPKIENKKASAIVSAFPTPHQLFAAFHAQSNEMDKQLLLRDLDTAGEKLTTRKCTVGVEAAKNMYVAYGMSKAASERPSYLERVEQVRQQQQRQKSRLSMSEASNSNGSREKPPASSRRPSLDVLGTTAAAAESFQLSQASNASSRSSAHASSALHRSASRSLSSSTAALPTIKPPPPPPPSSSMASSQQRPPVAPHRKPPPAAAAASSSRSQSQESSSSAAAAMGSRRPDARSSSQQLAAVDESIIDLCDDESSADDEKARGSHRSDLLKDQVQGEKNEEGEDGDDDYDYSPVVKDASAAYLASLAAREPLASLLPNGVPTLSGPEGAAAAAATASRPAINRLPNRYSLGSLSTSSSSSSALALLSRPAVATTGTASLRSGHLHDSSDDDDESDSDLERSARREVPAKKPPAPPGARSAASAAPPPKRKAREPEVYEILSD